MKKKEEQESYDEDQQSEEELYCGRSLKSSSYSTFKLVLLCLEGLASRTPHCVILWGSFLKAYTSF